MRTGNTIEEPELDLYELEDHELVQRSQACDRQAFGELIRRHCRQQANPTRDDWSNLDVILHRLTRSFTEREGFAANPEERLMRMQLQSIVIK